MPTAESAVPGRRAPPSGAVGAAIAAGALVLVAVVLPVEALLDWGSRWGTVAGFRADYRTGLQVFRVALALNAIALAALPWVLSRFSPPKAEPRFERWPMAVLFVLALAVSFPALGSCFQQDEYRCLKEYVRHGPAVILTRSPNADNHVLYSLLAWPFVRLFGEGEVPQRLPAWLLTALAPVFLYATLRRRHGLWTSFASSAPLSLAFYVLYFGAEGRGYGPMLSAVLALCWLRPRSWWAYVLAGVAAVGFQIFAAAAVVALSARRDLRLLSALGVIGSLSFLLYSMMIPQMIEYSARASGGGGMLGFQLTWSFVGTLPGWWALPFGIVLLLGLWRSPDARQHALTSIVCSALLFGIVSGSGSGPSPRFLAPAAAILWLAIAHGVAATWVYRPGATITLLTIFIATALALGHQYRLGKRDFRGAARELRDRQATDVALFHDCRPMEAYFSPARVVEKPEGEWFLIVDQNLTFHPAGYELVFRLPSTGGEVRGYRRIRTE